MREATVTIESKSVAIRNFAQDAITRAAAEVGVPVVFVRDAYRTIARVPVSGAVPRITMRTVKGGRIGGSIEVRAGEGSVDDGAAVTPSWFVDVMTPALRVGLWTTHYGTVEVDGESTPEIDRDSLRASTLEDLRGVMARLGPARDAAHRFCILRALQAATPKTHNARSLATSWARRHDSNVNPYAIEMTYLGFEPGPFVEGFEYLRALADGESHPTARRGTT